MCLEPVCASFQNRPVHILARAPAQHRPHILVRGLGRLQQPAQGLARRDVLLEAACCRVQRGNRDKPADTRGRYKERCGTLCDVVGSCLFTYEPFPRGMRSAPESVYGVAPPNYSRTILPVLKPAPSRNA